MVKDQVTTSYEYSIATEESTKRLTGLILNSVKVELVGSEYQVSLFFGEPPLVQIIRTAYEKLPGSNGVYLLLSAIGKTVKEAEKKTVGIQISFDDSSWFQL